MAASSFQFRLATLLRLRESERQQRQIELGQALEAEQIMKTQIDVIAAEIASARQALLSASSPGQVSVDSLLELQRYALQLKSQARSHTERLTRIRAEVERRRTVLVEADRQVRVLEKLREKQHQAFRNEATRREQFVLDEIAQRKSADPLSEPVPEAR